ncbi:MAG: acyl-phosphate glycerol 3-phosphate acyltransferase [Armatimonadetes bacterium CG2_30_59_28]|nr:glycerol-3-phosphate 1-O-acyltransferase PlsY [Armatimonadota bacterium]OIO98636.1 MAG: acyl-phosphate glycerol 3-phosphate acyltransferase [Armatimonadetes bacterium CG2_30_59_28]
MSASALWVFPTCYVIGSLPFGVLYGKLVKGVDIRQHGSGNIGASNVMRLFGVQAFVIVFALDALKGVAAILLCQRLFGPEHAWMVLLGGLLSVLGHTFSVFLKFTGGRGVATGLGLLVAVAPVAGLCTFLVWAVTLALTRYISVASIAGSISAPLWVVFIQPQTVPFPYRLMIAIAATLLVIRHAPNMKRLIAGQEFKLGQKVELDSQVNRKLPERREPEAPEKAESEGSV